jgi:hypothetical protein
MLDVLIILSLRRTMIYMARSKLIVHTIKRICDSPIAMW